MSEPELIPAVNVEPKTINPFAIKFNDLPNDFCHGLDIEFVAQAIIEKCQREDRLPKGVTLVGVRFPRALDSKVSFCYVDFTHKNEDGGADEPDNSGE